MTTPGISDLELLLADLESELVERKESFRTVADRVRETVCAFANDLPDHRRAGIVFIGAKDDGSPSGLAITDELLLQIADNRVEITSPGGAFGIVSPENFGEPGVTDYRNPDLAEAMRVLGFVQRFGAGIPIARQALAKNGNPPPEFDVQPAYLGVIVRPAP